MSWIQTTRDGVILTLRATPRSSRDEIAGIAGEALRIRLRAPPVDGKANKALLCLLADTLNVPRNRLQILGGETNRNKRVFVSGLNEQEARRRIGLG